MLRPAKAKDIPSLYILMRQFAIYDGSLDEFNISLDQLQMAVSREEKKMEIWVVEIDAELVGFINFFYSYSSFSLKRTIWVEDVFIREENRRGGIGNKIFKSLKSYALDNGISRIEWLVRKSNVIGTSFYAQLGAVVDEGTVYVHWDI